MVHVKGVFFCSLFIAVQVGGWIHGDLQDKRSKIYNNLAASVGEKNDPKFQSKKPPTWADIASGKVKYSPKNPSTTYEQVGPKKPNYADVISDPSIPNQFLFNEPNDRGINRMSHEGIYLIGPDGLPFNPSGPTGVGDRGPHGKYGVNHAGDAVVVRFICKDELKNGSKFDCYEVLINTRRDGRKGISGGLLNPFESLEGCVFREFREENMNLEAKKLLEARLTIFAKILAILVDKKPNNNLELDKILAEFMKFLQTDQSTAQDEADSATRGINRAVNRLKQKDLIETVRLEQETAKKEGENRLAVATDTMERMKNYITKLEAFLQLDKSADPRPVLSEIYAGYIVLILNEIKEKAEKRIRFHTKSMNRLVTLLRNVPVDDTVIKQHQDSFSELNQKIVKVNREIKEIPNIRMGAVLAIVNEYLFQLKKEVKELEGQEFLDKFPLDTRATLYVGYVNDDRQADRAWIEAYARLLRPARGTLLFLSEHLECGDDAKDMEWMPLSYNMELIASHPTYINQVLDHIKVGEFRTFGMTSLDVTHPTSHYVQVGIQGEPPMAKDSQEVVAARYEEIQGLKLPVSMITTKDLQTLTNIASTDNSLEALLNQHKSLHEALALLDKA